MDIVMFFFGTMIVSVLGIIIVNILINRIEDWQKLRLWVGNSLDGISIVCSVAAYNKARRVGQLIGGKFVFVPGALLFSSRPESVYSDYFSGTQHDFESLRPYLYPGPDLFVPFVSGKLLPYIDQEKHFAGCSDFQQRLREFRDESFRADFRLRWARAKWATGDLLRNLRLLFVIIFILAFCGSCVSHIVREDKEDALKRVNVYTTSLNGSAHVTTGTRQDLANHSITEWNRLYSGTVYRIEEIGGGQYHACIGDPSKLYRCGLVAKWSVPLKVGEKAFLREILLLVGKSLYSDRRETGIFVSEAEASSLLRQAGVHLERLE